MAVKLSFLFVIGLCVYCTASTKSMALRDYCDKVIYQKYSSPTFGWHPRTYIINYYKRCINHELWVDCIVYTRKNPPAEVKVESFEKSFPDKDDMKITGIIFCDFKLQFVKPNITNCVFNTTMCNQIYETGNACRDSDKKIVCIWGQLSKCGIDRLLPILKYEYGLLGGSCLRRVNKTMYTTHEWYEMARHECDDSGSAPTQTKPWTSFVVALGVGVGLTSMSPVLATMMKMMRC